MLRTTLGLLVLATSLGCAHERIARDQLEREGCRVLSMTKDGKAYVFEADCRGQSCRGTIEVRGTRWRHETDSSRHCVSR